MSRGANQIDQRPKDTLYLPPPLPLSALPSPAPPSLCACALSLTDVDIINTRRLSLSFSPIHGPCHHQHAPAFLFPLSLCIYFFDSLSRTHTWTMTSSTYAGFLPLSASFYTLLSLSLSTHIHTDHAIVNTHQPSLSLSVCISVSLSSSFSDGPCHQHAPALSLSLRLCDSLCFSLSLSVTHKPCHHQQERARNHRHSLFSHSQTVHKCSPGSSLLPAHTHKYTYTNTFTHACIRQYKHACTHVHAPPSLSV